MHGDLCGSLFTPGSIAVIGASETNFYARNAIQRLDECGYRGAVYPVNPRHAAIFGRRCYADLAGIDRPVDLAFIAVPRGAVIPTLRSCVDRGVAAAVVVTTGFGESDDGVGTELQAELQAFIAAHRIAVCGPSCLGVVNVHGRFQAFGGHRGTAVPTGGIALVSQSGANVHSYIAAAAARNLGFSYIVSSGNEAGVEATEYIDFFLEDANTRVVCAYIESFKAPQRLVPVARKALELGKPIVAIKIGLSQFSARAALAHTGAITGPDKVFDTLFSQFGVIRAYTIEEAMDRATLFDSADRAGWPAGTRGGVVSVSGGFAAAFTDLASTAGLQVTEFGQDTVERLSLVLPAHVGKQNPIDISTQVQRDRPTAWTATIDAVADDISTDFLVDAEALMQNSDRIETLVAARKRSGKPIVLASTSPHIPIVDEALRLLCCERALPVTYGVEGTVRALDAVHRFVSATHRRRAGPPPEGRPLGRPSHRVLTESEARAMLSVYGIQGPDELLASGSTDPRLKSVRFHDHSAVKLVSRSILHRSDRGLVMLDVAPGQVATAVADLEQRSGLQGDDYKIVIQAMVRGVAELLIGITNDPTGLPMIVVGLGGVLVELAQDRIARICPVDEAEAESMLRELRAFPLLEGYRGGPRADIAAAAAAIAGMSRFAIDSAAWLAEAEINPLVVLADGGGVSAVDALIVATEPRALDPQTTAIDAGPIASRCLL